MIKKKKDAEEFITDFKYYAKLYHDYKRWSGNYCDEDNYFEYYDGYLYTPNRGYTKIWFEDGVFYNYSHGRGWFDREPSSVDDPVQYVWKSRRWINQQLREIHNSN